MEFDKPGRGQISTESGLIRVGLCQAIPLEDDPRLLAQDSCEIVLKQILILHKPGKSEKKTCFQACFWSVAQWACKKMARKWT